MAPESANPGKEYCPVHKIFERDITDIKERQEKRPCQTHTAEISSLVKADTDFKNENKEQWIAINRLRIMVYMGAGATGVLAFLGSILGTYLKGR